MRVRRLAAAAATAAAFAAALVAPAGPAAAAAPLYVPQATSMLACPYVGPCAIVYNVPAGTYITGLCWTDAGWAYGTNR
ncbi:hypothetical protein [Micromonospora echinaurantiaca]|uniref:hypothetical protein n=1 Tax=Micromonospora echinaurantiaca TaxID=47857 RepID=UPI0034184326